MNRSILMGAVCLVAFSLTACSKSPVTKQSADAPVNIVATDSGFTIPDTLHSGLNHLVYENRGNDVHECMFIQLPDGMTPSAFVAQVKAGVNFPPGAKDCSGPGLTSPGEKVEMWVPLEEGSYMLGCWLGNHLTTQKPVAFVVHGAPATPVSPPHEDVTVRMIDYRYEFSAPLKSGEQVIRYETVGPSMHETDIVRLAEGRTVDDVRQYFKREAGPVPGVIAGGTMDSQDISRVSWVRRNFTPGHYVFYCDMPMIQNPSPADSAAAHVTHADAGMIQEVVVE
jgi:hypothetical protein